MHDDYKGLIAAVSAKTAQMRHDIPDVMQGFDALAKSACKGGALDAKTKELLAIAIAVAIRCDGCIAFHAKAAVQHGATRAEIMETMGLAIYMGAGPSLMYAAQAVEAFDQFAEKAAA